MNDKPKHGRGPFLEVMNKAEEGKAQLEKLETIAAEQFELIIAAQGRINTKLSKYERAGKLISRFTEKNAYEKTKAASDYFFDEMRRLNNELKEVIESYKKK